MPHVLPTDDSFANVVRLTHRTIVEVPLVLCSMLCSELAEAGQQHPQSLIPACLVGLKYTNYIGLELELGPNAHQEILALRASCVVVISNATHGTGSRVVAPHQRGAQARPLAECQGPCPSRKALPSRPRQSRRVQRLSTSTWTYVWISPTALSRGKSSMAGQSMDGTMLHSSLQALLKHQRKCCLQDFRIARRSTDIRVLLEPAASTLGELQLSTIYSGRLPLDSFALALWAFWRKGSLMCRLACLWAGHNKGFGGWQGHQVGTSRAPGQPAAHCTGAP